MPESTTVLPASEFAGPSLPGRGMTNLREAEREEEEEEGTTGCFCRGLRSSWARAGWRRRSSCSSALAPRAAAEAGGRTSCRRCCSRGRASAQTRARRCARGSGPRPATRRCTRCSGRCSTPTTTSRGRAPRFGRRCGCIRATGALSTRGRGSRRGCSIGRGCGCSTSRRNRPSRPLAAARSAACPSRTTSSYRRAPAREGGGGARLGSCGFGSDETSACVFCV
mmetsp:Transcript_1130/g.3978  ORF Transcript_1130/g.3978 Transcript_1130/m.3978 type:complete len:224 (-) Transcript_1130:94-765(-)